MSAERTNADEKPPRRRWLPEEFVASLALLAIVLITFANVIVRYFTNFSFAWTEDFAVLAMVIMVFAGAAGPTLRNSHIRIEILYGTNRAQWRRRLILLSRLAMALVFAALAILVAKIAYDEWYWGELASSVDVPRWMFTTPIALLIFVLSLRALALGRKGDTEASDTREEKA
ncbi:MAG: TRAP transporter small permease subunit [Rhizobiaceae bacterium]